MVGMEVVCRKIGSSHLKGEFRTYIRFSALILGISHLYQIFRACIGNFALMSAGPAHIYVQDFETTRKLIP